MNENESIDQPHRNNLNLEHVGFEDFMLYGLLKNHQDEYDKNKPKFDETLNQYKAIYAEIHLLQGILNRENKTLGIAHRFKKSSVEKPKQAQHFIIRSSPNIKSINQIQELEELIYEKKKSLKQCGKKLKTLRHNIELEEGLLEQVEENLLNSEILEQNLISSFEEFAETFSQEILSFHTSDLEDQSHEWEMEEIIDQDLQTIDLIETIFLEQAGQDALHNLPNPPEEKKSKGDF